MQSVPNPQSGRLEAITVTNDGATILKSMMIDNPASKILIGMYPKDMAT